MSILVRDLLFLMELCPKFKDKKVPENFLAEIEFC
jgi:hypothetical protein